MKLQHIALLLALFSGSAANANPAWEGVYVGASYALFNGENSYIDVDEASDYELEGQMLGAFTGFGIPLNRFILGGEVSFMAGAANEEDFEGEYEYSSIVDLKGRVGFDGGKVMPYAVLGASFGTFAVNEGPDVDFDQTEMGLLFGLGLSYAINNQFTVGAEFVTRSFEFEFPEEVNLLDVEATVNSLALRASYSF